MSAETRHSEPLGTLNGMAGGASRSFEEWYGSNHERVSRSLLSITGDRDLARDSTDEAFTRALANWARVSRMRSPEGWVFRVALNYLRRRRRRSSMERRVLELLGRETPTETTTDGVFTLLAELTVRQRNMIVLRYVADLSESAIADTLGVSRSTVSTTLTAARRRLAQTLVQNDCVHPDKEAPVA